MRFTLVASAIVASLALTACQPKTSGTDNIEPVEAETPALESEAQKQAYALGASLGLYINNRVAEYEKYDLALDKDLAIQGFTDGLSDNLQFSMQELQTLAQGADAMFRAKQTEVQNEQASTNIAEGEAYLAENANKEGVVVTESGLQYEVLTEGEGASPTSDDTVKVHYEGRLLDGTVFDSSYARNEPAVFPLSRVISGWTEGVQLMKEGSKFRFHIKPELAYGERSTGKITANSTLIFDVELIEVVQPGDN